MNSSTVRRSFFTSVPFRILLSAVMLAVLVWRLPDVKWGDLGPRWTPVSPLWLGGAALAMLAAFALSALRWQRVLSAMATPPPFSRMLNIFLAGQFVSNVLPSAFGGDVVRVARLGKVIDDRPRAFASVTIDRLTGWLVLPFITLVALSYQPELRELGHQTAVAASIATATLVALTVVLLVASNRRFARFADDAVGWRRFLIAIHVGIDALRCKPARALEVIAVGLAFQFLQCLAIWFAGHGIGIKEIEFGVVLVFFPAVAIAQNLPIGLGGLGIRESMFAAFFGAVGADPALSITLGLVVYLITIITSSFGAPSFAVGHRHGDDADVEAEAEAELLSHRSHLHDVTRPPSGP